MEWNIAYLSNRLMARRVDESVCSLRTGLGTSRKKKSQKPWVPLGKKF